MIKKRLAEIEARRLEIRTSLETDKNADLDALENEVRELELEEKQLERRQALLGQAEAISTGEAEARNLGLGNKIYFTGYLDSKQVQKMYKCADVAVFPSTYEPFGIVALEAMLAGVPTVVSDVGGLNEIINHGVDGMKSYAGNPNSIADSVTALLKDHQLAANVSKKAKQKVKEQFNWEKIAQDTHFTYEKAICQTMAERQA